MNDGRVEPWDALIVGGGIAGMSAAIYLGRSRRRTLIVDAGHSMAKWEPLVENFLGFPEGLSGERLLERGRNHAQRFGAEWAEDDVQDLRRDPRGGFAVHGRRREYHAQRVLLATGLTHLLPEIPGARDCLGTSLFFCKDCDAFRVQGRRIVVIGSRSEAARYALAMLAFSPAVVVATHGETPSWERSYQDGLERCGIGVRRERVSELRHAAGAVTSVVFASGHDCPAEAVFATRGDVFHTRLAEAVGAAEDREGQLVVDADMRTTVPGLYAAGCVTPANCQMIIAAGQGATAAQAMNRDLFEHDLAHHTLPTFMGAGAGSPIG